MVKNVQCSISYFTATLTNLLCQGHSITVAIRNIRPPGCFPNVSNNSLAEPGWYQECTPLRLIYDLQEKMPPQPQCDPQICLTDATHVHLGGH